MNLFHRSRQHALARRHRPRGVALMLVMVAIIVSGTVAYSYLGSQSTSVGIARNIRASEKARYVAESGMEVALAAITKNSSWRTQQPNGTWITDQSLAGGTFTIVGQDGSDTNNDGVVDGDGSLSDDGSDLVTLTVTGKADGAAHVLKAVVTPIPGVTPFIIYGESGADPPRYRTWSGSAWSSEQNANDGGTEPRWVVNKRCPTRNEVAACVLNSGKDLSVQFYTGSTWSTATQLTSNTVTVTDRPYDMAYEQSSGDLLIAYRSNGGNDLRYRTYNGTTLSGESAYTLSASNGLKFVRLVSKSGADEIVAITLDGNKNVCAAVWNGSSWGNGVLLDGNAKAASDECISAAYETTTGRAIVAWSSTGYNGIKYRIWTGSSWLTAANGPALGSLEPRWLKLAPDPGSSSNQILLGTDDGNKDIYVATWNGSAWSTSTVLETNTPDSNSREFDIAYEGGGTKAMIAWGRSGQNNFYYRTWNGSTWSSELTGPGLGDKVRFAQLVTGASGQIFISIMDKTSTALETFLWNGSSLSSLGTLEANLSGSGTQEPFMTSCNAGTSGGSSYTYSTDWK